MCFTSPKYLTLKPLMPIKGVQPPFNYPRAPMEDKSSLQNLTPNRPINGQFLNLTNSSTSKP